MEKKHPSGVTIIRVDENQKLFSMQCQFVLNDNQNIALVDSKGRIRGLYRSSKYREITMLEEDLDFVLEKPKN
jgi:hypothetical protein